MLFLASRLRPALNRAESGIAVPEVLTSAIIIVLILTANAWALVSAYTAYATSESANKAYQIINQQFAYFRQAPFNQLSTYTQANANVINCDSYVSPFNTENVITSNASASFKGSADAQNTNAIPFQLCQGVKYPSQAKPKTLYDLNGACIITPSTDAGEDSTTPCTQRIGGGLGVAYTYQTVITSVSTNSFDSSTLPEQSDSTTYYNPKRITVTVKWTENDSAGNSKTQQVRLSTVRTPTIGDCAPSGIKDASGATIVRAGCGAS